MGQPPACERGGGGDGGRSPPLARPPGRAGPARRHSGPTCDQTGVWGLTQDAARPASPPHLMTSLEGARLPGSPRASEELSAGAAGSQSPGRWLRERGGDCQR